MDYLTVEQVAVIERFARFMLYLVGGVVSGFFLLFVAQWFVARWAYKRTTTRCDVCGNYVTEWTATEGGNLCDDCWLEDDQS